MGEKKQRGRPTAFKDMFIKQAKELSILGLTDEQMAGAFDIALSTFSKWKHDYPDFMDALKDGKLQADAKVTRSLYERANGFSHQDTDIRVVNGEIVQTSIIKHYPPDTTACIFWLKNRQPDRWRDKVEEGNSDKDVIETLAKIFKGLPD